MDWMRSLAAIRYVLVIGKDRSSSVQSTIIVEVEREREPIERDRREIVI